MTEGSVLQFVLQEYGYVGGIIIAVIVGIVKSPDPLKAIGKLFNWAKIHRPGKYNTPQEILLSKLDYWLNFKIMNIKMDDPGRQLLFRDILQLKFLQFREYIEISSSGINESMSGQELYHVIVESFNETVDAYEQEAISRGIPEIVMVKYGEWQLRSYEFTLRAAEMICLSHSYGSNFSRMQAVISLVNAMMELTVAEAEKTLTDLNGELTGTVYKGVTCG